MGIFDKIEEIRKKPEHIRLRYVWFFVVISMLFVLTLWFFSIKSQQAEISSPSPNIIDPDIINQFNEQTQSLGNSAKQLNDITKQ